MKERTKEEIKLWRKLVNEKQNKLLKTIKQKNVYACHGLATGWHNYGSLQVEWGNYGTIGKGMKQLERGAFRKWWKEQGATLFAQYLWKENKACLSELSDGSGDVVVLWANRGNKIYLNNKSYKEIDKQIKLTTNKKRKE